VSALVATVRAETFKLLRKRRVYVLAFLYWVVLPAIGLIVGRLLYTNLREFEREGLPVNDLLQSLFSAHGLATVALTGPAYMSPTPYIIAVVLLAALFIGEERGQNMWKTVLVVQPDRPAVLTGKLVVAMGALLALMLGAFLSAILFGTVGMSFLPTDLSGDWLGLLGLYLWQWAHLLAPVLLAFLLIFLVRSAVLGIVMVLLLPGLIEGLYTVLNTLFNLQPLTRFNAIFQALRLQRVWEAAPRYFFTTNLYAPGRTPAREIANELLETTVQPQDLGPLQMVLGTTTSLGHAAAVMAGYVLVFGLLLYWLFRRRDVD
jgi:ABC-type transport system involved in multi-copper enzyme maturation permease subunit